MSPGCDIRIARVYDKPVPVTGARILVDRVWPRGVRKADLAHDDWIREVAPSSDLRKWFNHDPEKWELFRQRYLDELADNPDAVDRCLDWCRKGPLVLLFGAKDTERNQAVVLRDYLCALLAKEDQA